MAITSKYDLDDLVARIVALEEATLKVADLPMSALQDKLESDWQPNGGVLLGLGSVTADRLAGEIPAALLTDTYALASSMGIFDHAAVFSGTAASTAAGATGAIPIDTVQFDPGGHVDTATDIYQCWGDSKTYLVFGHIESGVNAGQGLQLQSLVSGGSAASIGAPVGDAVAAGAGMRPRGPLTSTATLGQRFINNDTVARAPLAIFLILPLGLT